MKVIICGAGLVGEGIAHQLVLEEHDVTVIDSSEQKIADIRARMDLNAFCGLASNPEVLAQAGADNADMIIAVMPSDEINMITCQIAYSIFSIKRKIARIRNQMFFYEYSDKLFNSNAIPIDVVISPESEVASAILDRLHVPGAIDSLVFADGKIKVISVRSLSKSLLNGLTIAEANEKIRNINAKIISVEEEQKVFYEGDDKKISEISQVFFVSDLESIQKIMRLFGHEEVEGDSIRIIGGGRVGFFLAKDLEKFSEYNIKIIEQDTKRAEFLALNLSNTDIINGSAIEQSILQEVNIEESDTIISVSNNDQVNILSALLAKKLGCKKAFALVNNSSFAPLFSTLGIDTIVNPREITVSSVLRYIRRVKVNNAHSICASKAELIEYEVLVDSYFCKKKIADLKLPSKVSAIAISRAEQVLIPDGQTILEKNDKLIIISDVTKLKKLEKILAHSVN